MEYDEKLEKVGFGTKFENLKKNYSKILSKTFFLTFKNAVLKIICIFLKLFIHYND